MAATAPPLPAAGGSYELQAGEWVCTQQTTMPAPEPEPECAPCTAPPPDMDPETDPIPED